MQDSIQSSGVDSIMGLVPMGDCGFLARFASEALAKGWATAVRNARVGGVADVVLAYDTVGVFLEARWDGAEEIEARLRLIEVGESSIGEGAEHSIPVLYDGEDLEEIARLLGLGPDAVVILHSGRTYRVQAMGFLPGFPYAGDLDGRIAGLPRRGQPRTRVPAGSVAIVGNQTGIYPEDSPGGWHLLGRTPLRIADMESGFFPMRAGDRIRFVPIDSEEYRARFNEPLASDRIASRHSPRPR